MATQGYDEIPAELKAAIRKEAVEQVSKWVIGAFVVLGGAAVFGWWLFLKPIIIDELGGVPKGAVAAFDLTDGCPGGWKSFDDASGRFLVGSGQSNGLTPRLLRAVGGDEEHALVLDELPPMQLTIQIPYPVKKEKFDAGGDNYEVMAFRPDTVSFGGTSKAISMMPPFLALTFCKKT